MPLSPSSIADRVKACTQSSDARGADNRAAPLSLHYRGRVLHAEERTTDQNAERLVEARHRHFLDAPLDTRERSQPEWSDRVPIRPPLPSD